MDNAGPAKNSTKMPKIDRPALSGGCPGDWSVGDPAYNPGLVRVGLTGALPLYVEYYL